LRRLLDAVMVVSSELSLPVILRRIVEMATDLVDARYGALGVLDPTRSKLQEFITVGLDNDTVAAIGHVPAGHGILGLLIVEPKPLRLPDLTLHPDSYGFPPHHPPMTSFLGVPILLRGVTYGDLYLAEKADGGDFTEEDEDVIQLLAAQAAVAIENARLYESSTRWLRQLESVNEIGNALASELELDPLLAMVAQIGEALDRARIELTE